MEQSVDFAPMVQTLDALVPQTVEQLDVSLRTAVREPQLAEQLMEVPTIVSYSRRRTSTFQGRGGRKAGLRGFPPEQGSTAPHFSEERISERIVHPCLSRRSSRFSPRTEFILFSALSSW